MRSVLPAIAPFFRSDAQGRILACSILGEAETSLSEIAKAADVPSTTVQREVDRLVEAGVLLTRKRGRVRFVRPDPDYMLLQPLRQIVAATYGPLNVVTEAFAGSAGAERLIVFGSWAARIHGEPGPLPNDIDVLIVGDMDRPDIEARAFDAGEAIGLDVNVTFLSVDEWEKGATSFVATVKSRPMVDMSPAHASSQPQERPQLSGAWHRAGIGV